MHGNHEGAPWPLATLTLIHALLVAVVAWLLIGGGLGLLDQYLPLALEAGDGARRLAILTLSAIYLVRFAFTGFVLLPRRMGWREVGAVGPWLAVIHLSFAILGGPNPNRLGALAVLGLALYLVGSYLNTASEWQRQRWKANPSHRGQLFTGGLYRICMHPNYLGDVVLFTGFALVTGRWPSLLVPAVMTMGFVFAHIPTLDAYLAQRYGEAFDAYAGRTPRLFPGIW